MIGGRKFRTGEARRREKKRMVYTVICISTSVVALSLFVLYALHHSILRINAVTVESNGVLAEDVLRASILNVMEGTHALFLPNDSVLHIPRTNIVEAVMREFPRIHTVRIDRVGIKDVVILVEERRSDALWCGDVVPVLVHENTEAQQYAVEEAWGTCYLMDASSFIYDRAPLYTGNMYTRYYGTLEHAEPVGQSFVSSQEFSAWQSLAKTMRDGGHSPVAILFTDEHDVEVYMHGGIRVLMPRKELERARIRLNALYESPVLDVEREIEYIDLRFGTKAFVKYWNDEESAVDEPQSSEP